MQVLYITYIDFEKTESGSSLRPKMMYQAFKDIGINVKLLTGACGFVNKKTRKQAVKDINLWLDENRPDFCYVENSTYPLMYSCDRRLLSRIYKMEIPIGYFFRDAYYRFPIEFPPRSGFINFIKRQILLMMYKRDEKLINRIASLVYLPSLEMNKYLGFKIVKALPPAGTNHLNESKDQREGRTAIYVGGLSGYYKIDEVLCAFERLNRESLYRLILVCRESEYKKTNIDESNFHWLEVCHTSGEGLVPLYRRASFALICSDSSYEYNTFAVSVKLYEYMSYGLPILGITKGEMARVIGEYDLGLVVEKNVEKIEDGIKTLSRIEINNIYRNNVEKALINNNLWTHRAKEVVNDLNKKSKNP